MAMLANDVAAFLLCTGGFLALSKSIAEAFSDSLFRGRIHWALWLVVACALVFAALAAMRG